MKELSEKSIVDLILKRSREKGAETLYTFLIDGEEEQNHFSYQELETRSRALAALLQQEGAEGERALLLYPPGLDYIAAFYGCLFAGTVAVPAYPPDPNRLSRTLPRLLSMILDSDAKYVLTTETIKGMAEFLFEEAPQLRNLKWIATDSLDSNLSASWKEKQFFPEQVAFLQYTSGSTGNPKGVILTHQNLLENSEHIRNCFGSDSKTHGVIWLPPYHDMGLIGGILQPLYVGFPVTLMSPLDFLQKPLRWLQAISKYKGTASGGPNFAYDLCIRKATPEIVRKLDLSSWTLAFTGAEPIQAETIRRFVEIFGPCGFREESFYPCYGLAEATLIVSGGKKLDKLRIKKIDKKALENHVVKEDQASSVEMLGCGSALPGQEIKIVDPETLEVLPDGNVGEIWVCGKSIAQGYWKKEKESREAFHARTREGKGPFLRTGDLGFLDQGELYVTGRIKDMMIFHGANHYPQDIELSVEKLDLPLRAGCGAVFSITEEGEEKLVVVWEVDERNFTNQAPEGSYSKIREGIARNHELHVHAIVFVRKGSVPKTSSGKIQRQFTKDAFLEGSLDIYSQWIGASPKLAKSQVTSGEEKTTQTQSSETVASSPSYRTIEKWLVEKLASKLEISEAEIDLQRPFQSFGLDSKEAVGLSGELEDWLGRKVSPTLLWQYPNIESLAKHLSQEGVSHASGTYS